jgi:uncharacterized membrane protein
MSDTLKRLAELRQILLGMEKDFGLAELSEAESKVLYAVRLLMEQKSEVTLTDLQGHPMIFGMSRSTFFRALRHLVDLNLVVKTGPEKRDGYSIKT